MNSMFQYHLNECIKEITFDFIIIYVYISPLPPWGSCIVHLERANFISETFDFLEAEILTMEFLLLSELYDIFCMSETYSH